MTPNTQGASWEETKGQVAQAILGALGFRGALAMWILQPVINEVLVKENKL